MRRKRKHDLPPNPKSTADLVEIPQEYARTLVGETFLIHDNHAEKRILVFSTRRNLEFLATSQTWFLDGTFSVSPPIFTQVFTILGTRRRNVDREDLEDGDSQRVVALPFVYALLSSKTSDEYTQVLNAVVRAAELFQIRGCTPARIMSDFELSIINAARAAFADSEIGLCMFHLGQFIYRHLVDEGLSRAYDDPDDRGVKLNTHMLLALAFVPPEDVKSAYRLLREEIRLHQDELIPVADYFDATYVNGPPPRHAPAARGRGRGRGRGHGAVPRAMPPRYPIETWNHYQSTIDGRHRTNNVSEGWHNRFRLMVNKQHPDLFSLIKEFQKEQADTEASIAELSLGKNVKAMPKKKWVQQQKRIRRIVQRYAQYKEEDNVLEYLENLACNIAISLA